jgi:hypothetical protein
MPAFKISTTEITRQTPIQGLLSVAVAAVIILSLLQPNMKIIAGILQG